MQTVSLILHRVFTRYGIEAISSIQEQDGDVTFLVEPRNKAEALSKIANLLKIYLYLPSSPLASSYVNPLDSNLAVQRLTSQIQHLNSQLTSSNSNYPTTSGNNTTKRFSHPATTTVYSKPAVYPSSSHRLYERQ